MPRKKSGGRKKTPGGKSAQKTSLNMECNATTSHNVSGSQSGVRKESAKNHSNERQDLAVPVRLQTGQDIPTVTTTSQGPSGSQCNVSNKKQPDNFIKLSSAAELFRTEEQGTRQEMGDEKEKQKKKKKRKTRQNKRAKAPESLLQHQVSSATNVLQVLSAPQEPRGDQPVQQVPVQCSDWNTVERMENTNTHTHPVSTLACCSTLGTVQANAQEPSSPVQASSDQDISYRLESGGQYLYTPEKLTVQQSMFTPPK